MVLALSALDVHHSHQGVAARLPLGGVVFQVVDCAHEPAEAHFDQNRGVHADAVAVVAVEVGGEGAAALVAEVVGDRGELVAVGAGLAAGGQLGFDQLHQELFGLDFGHLHVSVGVSVQQKLLADRPGQEVEQSGGFGGELRQNVGVELSEFQLGCVPLLGQDVVDLRNQGFGLSDELDQTLGDQEDPVVLSGLRAGDDDISQFLCDLVQLDSLGLNFLADEGLGGPSQKRALQGNVRGGPAHQTDEVVVLLRGDCVDHNVADQLGVGLAGGVEAEADLDVLVLQVAVNGLGSADHARAAVVLREVLRQQAGVGVRVIAADDDQPVQLEALAVLHGLLELLGGLDLVAAGHDHVETWRKGYKGVIKGYKGLSR